MKSIFNETLRKAIQQRVSHYFQSLRKRKGYTQAQLSKKTNLSVSQIKKLESQSLSPIVNSIETLANIATIDNLSVHELIGTLYTSRSESEKHLKFERWQQILLDKFSMVGLTARRSFIHGFLSSCSGPQQIESMIDLFLIFNGLDEIDKEFVIKFCDHLKCKNSKKCTK